ncbi:ArgP/LysG family DNA-binding transcriptional regulator, partial [bacterium]|nr:ArgP/LysG family DNA-binding transcriptional regulator [bacterium]
MLDYRGLEALYTVILLNSFEAAAQKLHLSQSAISQRIKNLENQYGHSLLSRSNPYKPTKLGSTLLQHFRQIHLLETSLNYQLEKSKEKPTYTIALSRDCMETWFLDFLHAHDITNALLLDIITVDQEKTIEYVKRGMAAACISTSNKKSHGTKSIFLGEMEYLLVATPKYLQKHFLSDDPKSFFENAVALKFDQEDHLMNDYLKKYFPKQTNNIELNY